MKMNVIVEKVSAPKLSEYKIGEEAYRDIGMVIARDIQEKIKQQTRADGAGPIKQNAPSTRRRKLREGRPAASLIDKFKRFVSGGTSAWNIEATNTYVEITPGGHTGGDPDGVALSSLARWVQEAGYVGWFAISKDARRKIKVLLSSSVREFFASRHGGGRGR